MKQNRREFLQGFGGAALSVQIMQGKIDDGELELEEGDAFSFDENSIIVIEFPEKHSPTPESSIHLRDTFKSIFGDKVKFVCLFNGAKLKVLNPK